MIYNKGVATIPGAASGPSVIPPLESLSAGQAPSSPPPPLPSCDAALLMLEEGFVQQKRLSGVPRPPRDHIRFGGLPRASA